MLKYIFRVTEDTYSPEPKKEPKTEKEDGFAWVCVAGVVALMLVLAIIKSFFQ